MALPFVFAVLPTGNVAASDLDTNFNSVGLMGVTLCTASGTNTIALTPVANQPTVSAYTNGQLFSFTPQHNTSGNATANINGIGALNLYLQDGVTRVASGDLVTTGTYLIMYLSALNGAVGGFQLMSFSVNRVTNPNLPYLSVQLNNSQSITSATPTKVAYDTVNEDSGSYWDAINFRFTPGVAGLYAVTVTVQGTGTTVSVVKAFIYRNGTQYPMSFINGGLSSTTAGISFFIRLNGSTDYVEGWGYVTANANAAFDTGPGTPATPTTMTIHRIGA